MGKAPKTRKRHKQKPANDTVPVRRFIDPLKELRVVVVTSGPDKGLARSVGMSKFGKPELLIAAGSPLFLAPVIVSLINEVAAIVLNNPSELAPGSRLRLGPFTLKISTKVYQDRIYWLLDDYTDVGRCNDPHCKGNHGDQHDGRNGYGDDGDDGGVAG